MSEPIQKCRVCGCTETSACSTPAGPCHWVEPNLCSAHGTKPGERELIVNREDLKALEALPPIAVAIDGFTALFLMSALQLACRHPGLNGPVHETVYDFARGLHERISVTPSLAAVCEAGWNPADDVPAKPEPHSGLILPGDPEFGV